MVRKYMMVGDEDGGLRGLGLQTEPILICVLYGHIWYFIMFMLIRSY